jgi:hypothetical protein
VRRLLVGETYIVPDGSGQERAAILMSAVVAEKERLVYCAMEVPSGKSFICSEPLSEEELHAWRRHQDTFFGVVGPRTTEAETPLDLYDFFHESFRQLPKQKLLEALANAPDFANLTGLDQPVLARIYAERITNRAVAMAAERKRDKQ